MRSTEHQDDRQDCLKDQEREANKESARQGLQGAKRFTDKPKQTFKKRGNLGCPFSIAQKCHWHIYSSPSVKTKNRHPDIFQNDGPVTVWLLLCGYLLSDYRLHLKAL